MDRKGNKTNRSGSTVAKAFTLLLVICLVECATEQGLNNRGSKSSNLIEKVNGWRSQRGGSCLSYGHSCWGAHGKRSGKPPGSAPDWYLAKILRHMVANADMDHLKSLATKNEDIDAIYQLNIADDSSNKLIVDNDDGPVNLPLSGNLEAKPMLDDDLISKMKLWKFMRETADDN